MSTPIEGDRELLAALVETHEHLELPEVVDALLRTAVRWSGARDGAVYLPSDGGTKMGPGPTTFDEGASELSALREDVTTASLEALLGGRTEVEFEGCGPFAAPGRPDAQVPGGRSVALPVRDGRGRLAAVVVLFSAPAQDLGRIRELIERAHVAVDRALEVANLRELVIKDHTANCYNRRHFEHALPEELARAARFRAPLSLIFFDLDNLKQVNTRHGTPMGSQTLLEVSNRVRQRIREYDKLFRFGGDEFCIVLPETEWHGALEVAERVRESLAASKFLKGLVADPDGVAITASFGIASYPLHARTMKEMVDQADRAMQRVKSGTKNSIAIAEILGKTHDD